MTTTSDEQIIEALRASLKETERLRRRNRQLQTASSEPVAVVGIGCRYPGGVRSAEELWELVESGRDAISTFPEDRGWDLDRVYDPDPEHPGTSYTREGGFIDDVAQFDAGFFGISPREALAMDPQQRLLLETSWEAVEDAGIDPLALRGSQTGIFAGVMYQDYGIGRQSVPDGVEAFLALGSTASVVSGRVAYVFGLEGPAVTVDTACSSSLVTLHLACQALRGGECSLALAGGVTVMATPALFREFSRQRGLASDGRCKSFAAGADGTGWSEGVGVLLLERLSDARRRGHRVLAVVRGSAVNQDGASNGLTAPNGPSQQRVIAQALANARLSATEVDAVEGHGTGTTLGDPIEAQALLAAYGQDRPAGSPLWLGSVKSNLGHTQAAAGVAGVIKMVMAMRHGVLPRTLHVDEPSREVDWSAGSVSLLTETVPWPAGGRARRAGISSFGISGTNSHVILEDALPLDIDVEADDRPAGSVRAGGVTPWVLSGRGVDGLRGQAGRLLEFVEGGPELSMDDVGVSLAARAELECRGVVIGDCRKSLLEGLGALAREKPAGEAVEGVVDGVADGGVAFVFPGQGSQWVGMGRELLVASPVFAEWIGLCEGALEPFVDWSLGEVLRGEAGAPGLDRVDVVQPVLWAVMVSLAGLWRACGVEPGVVVGHSQGEIAAAFVAGGLSLEDAARLVALRSRALVGLMGRGGMVSVALGVDELGGWLKRWEGVSVAAVNGPSSVVVSGEREALDGLLAELVAGGVRAREIPVGYASHSAQIDEIRGELLEGCHGIVPLSGDVPFFSTVTGGLVDLAGLDEEYWYRNLREPVQFERVTRALLGDGYRVFVEVSPHPVLTVAVQDAVDETMADPDGVLIAGSLRREQGGLERFFLSLGEVWVRGVDVDWSAVFAGSGAERIGLPAYAFQRERYWLKLPAGEAGDVAFIGQAAAGHPLLGAMVELADGAGWLFTGRISLDTHPWLSDHVAMDVALLPGAAFAELALHAGREVGCDALQELTLHAPLVVPERGGVQIQLSVGESDESARRPVSIHARVADSSAEGLWEEEQPWVCCASGTLAPGEAAPSEREALERHVSRLVGAWPPAGAEPISIDDIYDRLAVQGYDYGPVFQGLRAAWCRGEEVFAEVALPEDHQRQAGQYGMHPALLDAALHVALAGSLGQEQGPDQGIEGRFVASWSGVDLHLAGVSGLRIGTAPVDGDAISMVAVDEAGAPVLSARSLAMGRLSPRQLGGARARHRKSMFRLEWVPAPTSPVAEGSASAWAALSTEGSSFAGKIDEARIGTAIYADLSSLSGALDEGAPVPDVVWVDGAMAASQPGLEHHDSAGGGVVEGTHAATQWALALVQAWLAEERFSASRLVLVTGGAVAVRAQDSVPALVHAPAWGLLRSAQTEHPDRFVLVDLDDEPVSGRVLDAALASGEPQLAVREGDVFAARLARGMDAVERYSAGEDAPTLGWQGTVLITGGTGGLGALLARHLASEHRVPSLLLASRRGLEADGALELCRELEALGVDVTVAACDVSDRGQVEDLLALVPEEQPLYAVVHAAGVNDDGMIESLTPEQVDRMLAPKADAAWHLHELTEHLNLSAFVLFSSAMGTFGPAGHGNYAAANAFLDALAAHRRARDLPAIAMAWGQWTQSDGMAGRLDEAELARRARRGIVSMSSEEGLELFDLACGIDREPLVLPMRLDTAVLRAQARVGMVPALLRGLLRAPSRRTSSDAVGSLARRLVDIPEGERRGVVLEEVLSEIAIVLGHASGQAVNAQRAFKELGFDSLTAIELRNRLSAATGLRLPGTLIFDYPTPAAVAEHLLNEVEGVRGQAWRGASVAADEPIAIVGISCRYPGGVCSPAGLWDLVVAGTDAMADFPTDRGWDLEALYDPDPDHPGTSHTRTGGFVYGAGEFDAGFFGIGPREALAMDPQQRLLLETAWEAFEDAGIDPLSLRGSQTGVFAGINSSDYGAGLLGSIPEDLEGYVLTGGGGSVVSGRVAYTFGLEGPAVTVDTACSSSLVALHLACGALRQGECSLALAGGVTVMSTPTIFVLFSRQRALAGDGRCKAFADGADGTAWGEGAGVVLLERLADAQRLGHPVLAVVRGSAVNQDGASNGLTAPNGPSQQRVIARALANAGLAATQVDAVEAHGTGTTLGDPIEAQALLATYGQNRPEGRPLWFGSIKSNIGHTQAAAGVAGVIKMVMAMRHGVLPKTLHVDEPSREVDWSTGELSLLTENVAWPRNGEPRRAGISSFGVSGTNAHVILEEVASPADVTGMDDPAVSDDQIFGGVVPWVLSGWDAGGLRSQAERLSEFVECDRGLGLSDVGLSLSGRSAFGHRAVVLGEGRGELLEGLGALAGGESAGVLVEGVAEDGGVAFLFTGQGAQRVGMGRELYGVSAVFRDALDEACECFAGMLTRPLQEVLFAADGSADAELLDQTVFTQAALFAIEVALFRLVEGWGVRPDFLLGHSIGEVAAACVADVFSLEDACRLVAARGRLMGALPAGGAMVSVQASEEEILPTLEGWQERVALGAVNGPFSVVLSGDEDAVLELAGAWAEQGRKTKRLRVSHAFHSPRIDGMLEEFTEVAEGLSFAAPRIPIVSNVTGEVASVEELGSPRYWARHARETVRFLDGVRCLRERGVKSLLELGPDGVLSAMAHDCSTDEARDTGRRGENNPSMVAVSVLRRERPEARSLLGALAGMWVRGVDVDWAKVFAGSGAKRVGLPSYAFQRERYWLTAAGGGSGDLARAGQASADHPLLSAAVALADGAGWLFTGRLSVDTHPWIADHVVLGTVLLPGTAFVELALRAGSEVGCDQIVELTLQAPLVLDEPKGVQIQISMGEPGESGRRTVGIYSRAEHASSDGLAGEEQEWVCHATGILAAGEGISREQGMLEAQAASLTANAWPPPGAEVVEVEGLYDRLASMGLEYGPVFQGLRRVWRRGDELFAEAALPEDQRASAAQYAIHPALLDAAMHAALADPSGAGDGGSGQTAGAPVRLPFSWSGVGLHAVGAARLRVRFTPAGTDGVSAVVADESGTPVALIQALVTRTVSHEQLAGAGGGPRASLFHLDWTPFSPSSSSRGPVGSWAVLGAQSGWLAGALASLQTEVGAHADLGSLLEALDEGAPVPEAVFVDCGREALEIFADGVADGAGSPEVEELRSGIDGMVSAVHVGVQLVLGLLHGWLADARLAGSRLVVVTHGAVAGGLAQGVSAQEASAQEVSAQEAPDLVGASVWGLVRSAQSEHPGRFVLVDLDGEPASVSALGAALKGDEPQLAVREGDISVARLAQLRAPAARSSAGEDIQAVDWRGTVLVTGGTGGLGALLARHLVVRHGVRSLLLASRRGLEAEGAPAAIEELEALGASVSVAACDVSERDQVEGLLALVPMEFPLGAVVHAAGVLDDGVVESLTAERVDRVLAPKVDGAWHLHELTEHLGLSAFVLFSAAAATFGNPGQGNYAAANTFLDGLAAYRRARGLSGIAMAWGQWEQTSGMTGHLGERDQTRLARSGVRALSVKDGLELFDLATEIDEAQVLPICLDAVALRVQARTGTTPAVLRGLIRTPSRRSADGPSESLAQRLADIPEQEHERVVLELVCAEAASVLGYTSARTIDERRPFKELGFDSLAAVELRNRLSVVTGLHIPASLVFDYPTPIAVASHLLSEATEDDTGIAVADAELDRLELALSSIAADDLQRARMTARIQKLLSRLNVGEADAVTADEDLEAASDDEVFSLIDKELGGL
jgi:acyl transferase domain-containing protein/acyl carrier protein